MASSTQEELYVIKRNGKREEIKFDEITERINYLAHLEPSIASNVSTAKVAQKVIETIKPGIRTSELDQHAAETAAYMSTVHPAYDTLAARLAISDLHKKTKDAFSEVVKLEYECVNPETGEPGPLVSEKFFDFVQSNAGALDKMVDQSADYQYDYFGFKTLGHSYLFKVNGEIVERPQHMILRLAVALYMPNLKSIEEAYQNMSALWYTHATPSLYNAGRPRQEMHSCFLVDLLQDDSIEAIYDCLKSVAQISKGAGGVGLAISDIRAFGSYIRGTGGRSNGVVPMLKVFDATACYVDQGAVIFI